MQNNVIVTAEEFKSIHNAVCDIDNIVCRLEGVLNPELFSTLTKARDSIRLGLQGAYKQEDNDLEAKSEHYSQVQYDLSLTAIWSIYEVKNLSARHPFTGATKVHYKDHWGKPVTKDIVGATWAALYVAGDACIRASGDNHHVFIEQFDASKEDASVLIMQTGS